MKVEQVEDDPVREVSKGAVVHSESFSGIDHLKAVSCSRIHGWLCWKGFSNQGERSYFDIVQLRLIHGLEVRYLCRHPGQIVLHRII